MNTYIARLKQEIKAQEMLLQRYVELQGYAKVSPQHHYIAGLKQALVMAEQVQSELVR